MVYSANGNDPDFTYYPMTLTYQNNNRFLTFIFFYFSYFSIL